MSERASWLAFSISVQLGALAEPSIELGWDLVVFRSSFDAPDSSLSTNGEVVADLSQHACSQLAFKDKSYVSETE